jgi:LmbE family N-acetylglucosaminyl deacetylase
MGLMNILAVGAHIDDSELACGGTLAKAVHLGHTVKIIAVTDSSYTNYRGDLLRTREAALDEGRNAVRCLGVADFEVLNYPTKDVPYSAALVEELNAKIDEFNPDIIFTHWPHDSHKSHNNTALATLAAGRYCNSILLFEPIGPAGRSIQSFRPQVYVDISDFIEQKMAAVRAHQSELAKYGKAWIDAVHGRAHLRGFDMGVEYAEVFEAARLELYLEAQSERKKRQAHELPHLRPRDPANDFIASQDSLEIQNGTAGGRKLAKGRGRRGRTHAKEISTRGGPR